MRGLRTLNPVAKTQEMIMDNTQTFRISRGEWVCGGCGAPMIEAPDQSVQMSHAAGCPELANLRSGQA